METIADNLRKIGLDIGSVCNRTGRDPSTVRLIAVSKTKPAMLVRKAIDAGQVDIGESYVQEFLEKQGSEELSGQPVRWHFIGHLQSNKVKDIVGRVTLIHGIDKHGTVRELSKRALRRNITADYLIEVNTSGEPTKFGLVPDELTMQAPRFFELPHIRLRGLMTIASPDRKKARHEFRMLANLLDRLRKIAPEPEQLTELSMGMSQDYDIAIEEGATMIRIGTAIFGARNRKMP